MALCNSELIRSSGSCRNDCISFGLDFCAQPGYEAGFCCQEIDGCSSEIKKSTFLCSNDLDTDLKTIVCPLDVKCGYTKLFDVTPEWSRIFADSEKFGLGQGDQCSYQINTLNY